MHIYIFVPPPTGYKYISLKHCNCSFVLFIYDISIITIIIITKKNLEFVAKLNSNNKWCKFPLTWSNSQWYRVDFVWSHINALLWIAYILIFLFFVSFPLIPTHGRGIFDLAHGGEWGEGAGDIPKRTTFNLHLFLVQIQHKQHFPHNTHHFGKILAIF